MKSMLSWSYSVDCCVMIIFFLIFPFVYMLTFKETLFAHPYMAVFIGCACAYV